MVWYSPHGRIHMDEEFQTQHTKGREGVRMPCFLRTYQKLKSTDALLFLAQSARKCVSKPCLAAQRHAPPYFSLSSTPCVPECPPASGARMTSVGNASGIGDAVQQY